MMMPITVGILCEETTRLPVHCTFATLAHCELLVYANCTVLC